MFLMEPTLATDWPAAEAEVNRLLQRADAKVLGVKDWGERKLAYPIGQWKRGLYVLSYFEAGPESASALERDVHLSEKTIRVLVTRRDKMTPEAVEQALLAEPPSKTPARGDEWGGRWDARPPRRDRNIVKPAPQDADQATATPSKEEGARKDPEQAAPDAEKVPDEKKDTPA
jgi:ribosomal protein S6